MGGTINPVRSIATVWFTENKYVDHIKLEWSRSDPIIINIPGKIEGIEKIGYLNTCEYSQKSSNKILVNFPTNDGEGKLIIKYVKNDLYNYITYVDKNVKKMFNC